MSGWSSARDVLGIRLDAMGDVLMTIPALRALALGLPDRRLTLLTSASGAEAARMIPFIHEVIVYDAPWMKPAAERGSSTYDIAMVDQLRARRFDAAVIFTVYTQSALPAAFLCVLADIPLRAAHCRENPYRLLTDWANERDTESHVRHEVRRQLDLVESVVGTTAADDRISVAIQSDAFRRVDALLSGRIERTARWIVLHPGGSAPSRRYPLESFAAVARRLIRDFGYQILWTGSQEEIGLIDEAQRMVQEPSHSLAGQMSVEELAALIARAPLLISNNTSTVHLASAVGTPVVDLYALTNPQHTPWRVPCRVLFDDVPCRYCYKSVCPEGHHLCLRGVSPETVVRAAIELDEERKRREPIQTRAYQDNLSFHGQIAGSRQAEGLRNDSAAHFH